MVSPSGLKKYLLSVSLALGLCYPVTAQGKPQIDKLEIFVDDKKYESIADYKKFRINKIRDAALEKEFQKVEGKSNNITEKLTGEDVKKESPSSQTSTATDVAEMQELFNKLLKKKDDSELLIFDPAKVKTIKITPVELPVKPAKSSQPEILNSDLNSLKTSIVTQGEFAK